MILRQALSWMLYFKEWTSFSQITRVRFEELNMDLFDKCLETVERCLADAKVDKREVDDVVLVGGSSRIPKVQKMLQSFFVGKEPCKSVNPDEAVAYGAAIQAALLSGSLISSVPNLMLLDVTPLSLGFKIKGDLMVVLVPRNTPIPVKKKGTCYTVQDDQSIVRVTVYEGERLIASENNLLGLFRLSFPPAPRGFPVYISFEIDEDGILNVCAEEKVTGNKKEITISNDRERLSEKEIKRMIQEAEIYKDEDNKHKKKVDAMNALDAYVYKIKRILKDSDIDKKILASEKMRMLILVRDAKILLDDNQQSEKYVFEDFHNKLMSIWEPIMVNMIRGFSDDDSDH